MQLQRANGDVDGAADGLSVIQSNADTAGANVGDHGVIDIYFIFLLQDTDDL